MTGGRWGGGFRNTSPDAAGPRPVGRTEESKERIDHTAGSSRRAWSERTACAKTAGEAQEGRRPCRRAQVARAVIRPPNGSKGQRSSAGDSEAGLVSRVRTDIGQRVSRPETRHRCQPRNGAQLDDRGEALASPQAAHREGPRMAATPIVPGRIGAMGHQRARLAGEAWRETVPDQHDRRCHQPSPCAFCAARLHRREYAIAVELPGTAWPALELLHRQSCPVSDRSQDSSGSKSSALPGARAVACYADRPGTPGTGHPVDWSAFPAGQGACGTQLRHCTGP